MSEAKEQNPVEVASVIAMMIDQMASFAWQKLGLQPDMMTGQIVQDLPQARLAIDATEALSNLLLPSLDANDQREIKNLLSNLRVNYVERSR